MIASEDSNEKVNNLYKELFCLIREKKPAGTSRKHHILEFAHTNFTPPKTLSYGCDQCDFQSVEKGELGNHENEQIDGDGEKTFFLELEKQLIRGIMN